MLAQTINSLHLFNQYFGPVPFKTLAITQQPSSFYGQSWPTLVFMPYTAFLDKTTQHQLKLDDDRGSRAFLKEVGSHEIAHQWWGHLVGWKSYHDQWLSEGFAEYSAGLYVQAVEGEKKFRSFLETQRSDALQGSSNGEPPANSAGPIWLGHRLSTEKSRGAGRLIYSKGAYVLHMLRMMQYDFVRQDDSRFARMMQDFVSAYSLKNASTEDFKSIVDKHFGQDMGWFFKQWVYGTEVPDITVEYSVTENAKGALLKGTIRQDGVSPNFLIRMPCLLKFAKGASAGGFLAKGAATPFEVQLPLVPESVEFNPLDAVLCHLAVKKI
jgi:aminopeptidase N